MLDKQVKLIDTNFKVLNEFIPHYEISGAEKSIDIEVDDSRARQDEITRSTVDKYGKVTHARKSASEFYQKERPYRERLPSVDRHSKSLLKPRDLERKCKLTSRDRVTHGNETELYRSKSSNIPRKTSMDNWSMLRTSYSGFYFGHESAQALITLDIFDPGSQGKEVLVQLMKQRQKSISDRHWPPKLCLKKYKICTSFYNDPANVPLDGSRCQYGNTTLGDCETIRKGTLTRVRHTRTGLEIDTGKLNVLYPASEEKSITLSDYENSLPKVQQAPSPNCPKKARVERWVETQRLLHRRCIKTA